MGGQEERGVTNGSPPRGHPHSLPMTGCVSPGGPLRSKAAASSHETTPARAPIPLDLVVSVGVQSTLCACRTRGRLRAARPILEVELPWRGIRPVVEKTEGFGGL